MQNIKLNKYYRKTVNYIEQLGDIRYSGQLIFAVIIILLTWSGIRSVETNYKLLRQINEIKQQNQLQQLENSNIDLGNQYLSSNQYLDISARQNLGLALSGEQELLVPKSVALSYVVKSPYKQSDKSVTTNNPGNYQSWIDFFLHRNQFSSKS
jgi:Septum formation initiator